MPSLSSSETEPPEPPRLRRLRLLVTVLTATMIAGLLTIIAVIVITMTQASPGVSLPASIAIPAGERAVAFTQGTGWIAVVTRDAAGRERVRLLDAKTGRERQSAEIIAAP